MTRNGIFPMAATLVAINSLLTGCGGGGNISGSPASANVPHPLVRQFSPTMSPINIDTGQANPTYTDGNLLSSTDPLYPGKICVFFQSKTKIDPKSVFIGGNPALGIDLSALQILQYIPGTGNVPLAAANVQVLDDRIIFTPATLPLANGQYSVGVFANLKSVEGDSVDKTPVFHSFNVGAIDTIAPIVVVTTPINAATGIGAGTPPPAAQPGQTNVASVRTAIFGPTSPDVIIQMSETIDAATINPNTIVAVDAGAAAAVPPVIPPAPGFPKLKSMLDGSSLPSNGFEIVWRADPQTGGLPFGTQVQVTVVGSDGGVNAAPIRDRSGVKLATSYVFQFQTVAPPQLPQNPEPEYAIYWSASDRVGVLDTVNQKEIAAVFLGQQTTPIQTNVIPTRSDAITTKSTLGLSFDPLEISVDGRTDGASCHTFAYIQSAQSGEVVVMNTRTSLPAAIINTPNPGGLTNQTGGGQAVNQLLVTNSSANTWTAFNVGSITPGRQFLTGPIFISEVEATGNTPRAITITSPVTGNYNRDFNGYTGPGTPMILYADFTDGVLNTTNLGTKKPVKQFALGTGASPNDIAVTPCFTPFGIPPYMFAAISEGGVPGDGKVGYYMAGVGCQTGTAVNARPDSLVGELPGLDAPAGLDEVANFSGSGAFFVVAESGSQASQIDTLGLSISNTLAAPPRIIRSFKTGANPVAIAHVPSWFNPGNGAFICRLFTPGCPTKASVFTPPPCWYSGTEQYPRPGLDNDLSGAESIISYVCARGAGRIDALNATTGGKEFYSPIPVPGIRFVASTGSQ